jgi:hypothetical protein
MPDLIFAHPTGAVAHLSGALHASMANIEMSGAKGSLVGGDVNILITGLAVSQQVKVAYFSTLGDALYIYPLGNEMSKAVITGMALPASVCTSKGSARNYSAVEKIVNFYNDHKASSFSAVSTPVKIVIPPVTLNGFVESMTLEIGSAPAEFGFAKFTINMSVIPK